jgi:hypothetical protein
MSSTTLSKQIELLKSALKAGRPAVSMFDPAPAGKPAAAHDHAPPRPAAVSSLNDYRNSLNKHAAYSLEAGKKAAGRTKTCRWLDAKD